MKTILTPVDFSSATRGVLEAAADMARAVSGRVVLLHCIQNPVVTTDYGLTAEVLQETIVLNQTAAKRQIAHLVQSLTAKGIPVSSRLATGFAPGNILDEARKTKAAYIVLGSHGHTAFYELLVGSTTHAVLKKAPCPVLVVPPLKAQKKTKAAAVKKRR